MILDLEQGGYIQLDPPHWHSSILCNWKSMNDLICNFKFEMFNSNLRIQMNLCRSKNGLKIGNITFFLMKIFVLIRSPILYINYCWFVVYSDLSIGYAVHEQSDRNVIAKKQTSSVVLKIPPKSFASSPPGPPIEYKFLSLSLF